MKTYPKDILQPKAIGYWKSERESDLPDPHNFDLSIPAAQRQMVVLYLENGLAYIHYLGHSFCRFGCGKPYWEMGCADLTDSVYAWPEGLSHYIKDHDLWLPSDFIEHVMSNTNLDRKPIDQSKTAPKNEQKYIFEHKHWRTVI
jgi:hypothetical protein